MHLELTLFQLGKSNLSPWQHIMWQSLVGIRLTILQRGRGQIMPTTLLLAPPDLPPPLALYCFQIWDNRVVCILWRRANKQKPKKPWLFFNFQFITFTDGIRLHFPRRKRVGWTEWDSGTASRWKFESRRYILWPRNVAGQGGSNE